MIFREYFSKKTSLKWSKLYWYNTGYHTTWVPIENSLSLLDEDAGMTKISFTIIASIGRLASCIFHHKRRSPSFSSLGNDSNLSSSAASPPPRPTSGITPASLRSLEVGDKGTTRLGSWSALPWFFSTKYAHLRLISSFVVSNLDFTFRWTPFQAGSQKLHSRYLCIPVIFKTHINLGLNFHLEE